MRNRCSFPAGAYKDPIRSGVTGWEHTYATRSFIGASGLGGGAGGIGFAGIAGAVEDGGVSMVAGAKALLGRSVSTECTPGGSQRNVWQRDNLA